MKATSYIGLACLLMASVACRMASIPLKSRLDKDVSSFLRMINYNGLESRDREGSIVMFCYEQKGGADSASHCSITGGLRNPKTSGFIPVGDFTIGSLRVEHKGKTFMSRVDIHEVLGKNQTITVEHPYPSEAPLVSINTYLPMQLTGNPDTAFLRDSTVRWRADEQNQIGIAIRYAFGESFTEAWSRTKGEYWIFIPEDTGRYTFTSQDLGKNVDEDQLMVYDIYRGICERERIRTDKRSTFELSFIQDLNSSVKLHE